MEKKKSSLAVRMSISLVCGLVAGLLLMFLRENLNSTGKDAYGQRSTASCSRTSQRQALKRHSVSSILSVSYLSFFTACHRTDGIHIHHTCDRTDFRYKNSRQNFRKNDRRFPDLLFLRITYGVRSRNHDLQCRCVQYSGGGLEGSAGSTGSNPLNVILTLFRPISQRYSVQTLPFSRSCSSGFLGLCMKAVGDEKSATLKKLITEVNDIVVVFLNYVVTKFGPFAIFVLLARTFATYGINHLKPALAYVVVTVILLLVFLL